ncbi:CRISPR-associated endoribonuclease Cas6 [Persephonella sp.]|uniref:CRISPR-associated endoribonuclease Cas6 n=1 Tax=Persephonella sp. TaxID=2060922 RepID=UPI0026362ECA|nr:CRISPR-associated endoribonuclease Cas6 [Persephonella sp.]
MRLKLSFSSDLEYISLPLHHNYALQVMLYKNLPKVLSDFLHDMGFFYKGRPFKLFTFSKIQSEHFVPLKKFKKIKYKTPITLFVSSSISDITKNLGETFIKKDKVILGKNILFLESIEIQPLPEFEEEFYIKTLSPITVYRTFENEKKYYRYYSPQEKEFNELIRKNLAKKYNIITGEEIENFPIEIKPENIKKVLFKYKDFPIEAYEGIFKIKTKPEMFKVIYDAGLGAKNSQGFGMIEIMSED